MSADPHPHPCVINVDEKAIASSVGENLLDALRRTDCYIPHLCYNPALGPIKACDTCFVMVNGALVRACTVHADHGLKVSTQDAVSDAARREGMDRILEKHELYCSVCDNNNGDCEIHDAVDRLALSHQRYPYRPKPYAADTSNPFYTYDPLQCLLCGRCVEACQNVQVNETLTIDWEMEHPRVLWDGGQAINESSCVSCGHCVTVCPCNALMENTLLGQGGPLTSWPAPLKREMIDLMKGVEQTTSFIPITAVSKIDQCLRHAEQKITKTVCTYCGVGCSFDITTRGRHVLKVQPEHGPANGISTCVKGKFAWDFVNSKDRLVKPLIRCGSSFHEASWDEALGLVHERLSMIRASHGPDAIGFIATSKGSNEEVYLTQKFARAIIGTNNIDCTSRYCQSPATEGLTRTVGYAGDSGTMDDIDDAELVLLIGTNTADSHPVLATRIKRRLKRGEIKVVVIDLLHHEMAERAQLFLRPKPGTDLVWLCAVTRYILDNGLEDRAFLARRVNNLEALRASLAPFTLAYAEAETGLSQRDLVRIADMIVNASGVCALWAMGVTQRTTGSDTSTAISNLLLVTGNYGKKGSGAYPLRGHNNVQGAGDFGALSDKLPGYLKVSDKEARERVGRAWGVELPARPGLNNHSMINAAHSGTLHAMYIIGEDTAVVDANTRHTEEALERLDFLVVQDVFMTTTARFADVVLPACPSLEKEGTFVNTERRIQHFGQALDPLGLSRPDWRILCALAERFGHRWDYAGPREIMSEATKVAPLFAGATYDRLEGYASVVWPVDAQGHSETLLYTKRFHTEDGKAQLYPVHWHAPVERADSEYDLTLNNGRVLEHFQEGNLTARVPGLVSKVNQFYVEISHELADELDIRTGARVTLTSRRGSVEASVFVSPRVVGRELYTVEFSLTEPINRLTGNHADGVTSTPAFKELAVKLSILSREGPSPIPRSNPRFGTRTPQSGVEVERKWRRREYQPIPATVANQGGTPS